MAVAPHMDGRAFSPAPSKKRPASEYYETEGEDSRSPNRDQALIDALGAQTKALLAMGADKGKEKKFLSSTIRVNPTITWPKLMDEGPEARDVEDFFDRFDETCGLANDGAGMSDMERLKVLSSCLKGSREKTYKVLHKKHRLLGDVEANPGMVFNIIKTKLLRFIETPLEKQMRVINEWDNLSKGKLSALQFEPQWEEKLAELETAGLGRNERELMLNYLGKIGPQMQSDIMKDMRAWPDGTGGMVTRRVGTWEECHIVCLELESLKMGSKALNVFAFDGGGGGGFGGKGEGAKKGKGKGKHKDGGGNAPWQAPVLAYDSNKPKESLL